MLLRAGRAARAASPAVKVAATYDLHAAMGAKFGDFGGFIMPLQYADANPIQSALHCRTSASLFDVSHMCSVFLKGPGAVAFAERISTADVAGLPLQRGVLAVLPNENGGAVDDCVMSKVLDENGNESVYVVLNAGNATKVLKHIERLRSADDFGGLSFDLDVHWHDRRGLFALQGPKSASVLDRHFVAVNEGHDFSLASLPFGGNALFRLRGLPGSAPCLVVRCGYTGEDGFEIFAPGEDAARTVWLALQHDEAVRGAGLVARDILRVEAGLCLYGHELSEEITPAEAGLSWVVAPARRQEDAVPFEGKEKILAQIQDRSLIKKIRVGAHFAGMPPPREGALLYKGVTPGSEEHLVGKITSSTPSSRGGGFNVMGFARRGALKAGGEVSAMAGKRARVGEVRKMPFEPHRYHRVQ